MPETTDPIPTRLDAEVPADAAAVDALVLAAFGPGRFAKTAERLREGGRPAAGFVARDGGDLIGSVRLWPILIGETPALFLGPIAVAARNRKSGLGAELVNACLEEAKRLDVVGVLLIGDPPYFERFGFRPAAGIAMPGPVDAPRILWAGGEAPSGVVRSA